MLEVEMSVDVANHTVVVRLAGSADMQSSDVLHAALHKAMDESNDIMVDCSQLEFLSSMSLSELISTRLALRKRRGTFRLIGVPPTIRRLLANSKLEALLAVQPG